MTTHTKISDERLAEIVERYHDATEPFAEEVGMIARELQSLRATAEVHDFIRESYWDEHYGPAEQAETEVATTEQIRHPGKE